MNRFMSLRTKVLLVLMAVFGCYAAVALTVMQRVMLPAVDQIEQDVADENLQRVRQELDAELDAVARIGHDWSAWDDTYEFVSHRAATYVEANLTQSALANLELDVMLFFDRAGALVGGMSRDAGTDASLSLTRLLPSGIARDDPLLAQPGPSRTITGLMATARGPLLVTAQAVLRSDGGGPGAGALLFGRFLDSDKINSLRQRTRVQFTLLPAASPLGAGEEVFYQADDQYLRAFVTLHDVYGKQLHLLRVDTPRRIRALGQQAVWFALLLLAVASVLVMAVLWLLLRRLMLVPVTRLTERIRDLKSEGGVAAVEHRPPVVGPAQYRLGDSPRELTRNDEIGMLARAFCDMSDGLRRSAEQIWSLAYQDSLTGLPNRRLFMERARHSLQATEASASGFALLFLDLDDFKRINDVLGHDGGDALLREVAERLKYSVRAEDRNAETARARAANDIIARIGGDEFVILLDRVERVEQAVNIAERIIAALALPIALPTQVLGIGVSIGISICPRDGNDLDQLMKQADTAMYHAKQSGKNTYACYTHAMGEDTHARLALEQALRRALERDEFVLHYQPQIELVSGRWVGVEALLRWQHPECGLLLPDAFLPLAERTGLIVAIGEWVLREACRQAKAWQAQSPLPLRVAVNVSALQLERADFKNTVERILQETELAPQALELELTETSIIKAKPETLATLAALRALGVEIAMDDFGTGYSSLAGLRSLPIDALKIDRRFVRDVETSDDDRAITSAVIAMGRQLRLTVVAEGVETQSAQAFLQAQGCNRAQGYWFSRPKPAQEMTELLARQSWDVVHEVTRGG
ncbi:MAG: EAL domain-containing protein [Gammaproteobacteria bacterium]